ncbi:hypothetical protein [Carnobacterium divergens]|uniref:Uncharacterized protein n=1 Tax=Carnobacterium divergens DSM 20623 TaxID=1449336 RepID=A0A0R2HZG8_CARDV|nr:hypothetical protein [Carnobacterium divergens]KRN57915.1 hypothetical protein IV74_GL001172 [Carnobacterium divergens DSM 20623]MDO0874545.1 hypothetical protein [Carnobacterium divergens]SUX22338.1 Uncharacterised protein [Carnobacterium divergens]
MDKINTPLKTIIAIVIVLLLMLVVSKIIWKQPLNYSDILMIIAGILAIFGTCLKTKK